MARGTLDLSPTESRWFLMVLGDTASVTCARISSLDVATIAHKICRSWHASVPCSRPEPDLRVWECSTDLCRKQRHTTIHCAQHVQQSVDTSIQLPEAYNATLFKWTNCDNRCKMLQTNWHRMTINTFMTVNMCKFMPMLLLEGATLCIDVTVWIHLIVTCVFHLIWICYHILLQW